MMTRGQAITFSSNISSFTGLTLIATFTLAMALLMWQTAFNENPIANAMAKALYAQAEYANQ